MKEDKKDSVYWGKYVGKRRAGFTMVELLIAMMMTLIIVTAVGQFMAISSRTYQAADSQVNLQVEAQCTINMITDMILEGNNVVFDKSNQMLRIYKNLGSTDSSGNPVDYKSAEQNIIWFDQSGGNMYLFICKSASDYYDAYHTRSKALLMAEGIENFDVTCPTVSDLSSGLTAGRYTSQQHSITVSVKLKRTAFVSGGNDVEYTYEAVDTVFPRNEIVEL